LDFEFSVFVSDWQATSRTVLATRATNPISLKLFLFIYPPYTLWSYNNDSLRVIRNHPFDVIEYRFSMVLLRRKCLEIPNGNAFIL